jgi:hypothetical protein
MWETMALRFEGHFFSVHSTESSPLAAVTPLVAITYGSDALDPLPSSTQPMDPSLYQGAHPPCRLLGIQQGR